MLGGDDKNNENPLTVDDDGNLVDSNGISYGPAVAPPGLEPEIHPDHLLNPDPETSDKTDVPAVAPSG